MKKVMIVLNVLSLLAIPVVFYSAFEITEISTRVKIRKAEEAGAFHHENLNPLLAEIKQRTGYKKTSDAFAAWLTMDRPWQRLLLVPSAAILVLNTVALAIAGDKRRKESSAKRVAGSD